MNSINFVTGKNLDLEKQLEKVKYLKIAAIASLLIVAGVSVIIFIITLLLPVPSVRKQQDQALLGISKFHKKLVTHVLVLDRLKNITGVQNLRKDYPQIANTIINKMPQDLLISTFNIENGVFTLTVNGASLFSINQFVDDAIVASDKTENFKNFKVTGLKYDPEIDQYALTFQSDVF